MNGKPLHGRIRGLFPLFSILAFMLCVTAAAQNLVPNPSFESYSQCPPGMFNFAGFVDVWTAPTAGSPDYFNACAGSTAFAGVPGNDMGNQAARTGNAYAGFILRPSNNYREYVEIPLAAPLIANVAYQVSFYVSLADASQWGVDKLGAYLSIGAVGPVSNSLPLPLVPQITNPAGSYITDKTVWTLVSGTHIAAGGEDHLVIGNFADNTATTTQTGLGGFYPGSYYYIDDVSVEQTSGGGQCVAPPTDMVAWWPLDETTGSTVTDIVNSLNGATLPGPIGPPAGPGPTATLPGSFPPGMVGSSLFFGAGRSISVPHNTVLDPGTGDFTIDAWFIWAGGTGPIVQKLSPNFRGYRLNIYLDAQQGAGLSFETAGSPSGGFALNHFPVTRDQWHHVAGTIQRGAQDVMRLYLDGQPVVNITAAAFPAGATVSNNENLRIGGDGQTPGARIAVDEVEIFDRALSQPEIQGLFDAGPAGKCKCFPAPSGMVSWWRADGNATDSTDGNHGAVQGNAAFVPGMVNTAFSFAAQGDYVNVPTAANLNFGDATSSPGFSIDAWIETSSTAQVLPIVDKRDLSGAPRGYSLFLFDGKLALQLGDGTFFNYISSGPDLRDGQFHHVAVTVDRTSPTGAKLYVDGAVVLPVFNPMNRPGTLTNNNPLFIGRHADNPALTFIGLIDEVEIFDRALTQSEIQGISNAGPAGKCHTRRRRAVRR